MKFLLTFVVVLSLSKTIKTKEVCFNDLGCFEDTKPFGFTLLRPIGKLPNTPEKINTTFLLFNKNYRNGLSVSSNNLPSGYLIKAPTKVIIHGLGNSADTNWVVQMKNALLATGDINVIVVDWKDGSILPYEQACANTRVVGAVTARFLQELLNKKGVRSSDIHLIGFSLGAHAAGHVGERIPHIGRITGLDPAGPYYENTPTEVRLDPTDADFVDVIHTNALALSFGVVLKEIGFGIQGKCGHVDYYPNGGKTQPGCAPTNAQVLDSLTSLLQSWNFDDVAENLGCSHNLATKYFIESIEDDCQFIAYPCKSFSDFSSGKCTACSAKGCNRMGYFSSETKEGGPLYLITKSGVEPNTCTSEIQFKLTSDTTNSDKKAKGKFEVYLVSSTGDKSSTELIDDNETTFESGSVKIKSIQFSKLPATGKINAAYVKYARSYTASYEYRWTFKTIEVQQSKTAVVKMCPVAKQNLFGTTSKTAEYLVC